MDGDICDWEYALCEICKDRLFHAIVWPCQHKLCWLCTIFYTPFCGVQNCYIEVRNVIYIVDKDEE